MSEKAQEWRWVGEDGVEKTVTEQELIAELSSESLPNYTLVWRKGWLEWLPAMQVSELSWALPPGKSDEAVKAREKDAAAAPPAPPLYRYPVLKRRAANLRTDKPPPPGRSPLAAPRPEPKEAAAEPPTTVMEEPEKQTEPKQSRPSEPSSIEGPTLVSRPVEEVDMDTIEASHPAAAEDLTDEDAEDEDEDDGGTGFGGVAPKAAAFGRRAYGEEDDAETRVIPSRPPPPLGPLYVGPHVPPASERPPPSYDEPAKVQAPEPSYEEVEPVSGPDTAGAPLGAGGSPPSYEDDDDIPRLPPPPPPPPADLAAYAGAARGGSGKPSFPRKNLALALGGGAALLVVLAVVLSRRGNKTDAAAPAASTRSESTQKTSPKKSAAPAAERVAPAPKVEEPPPGKSCTVVTSATRIADWAEPAIVPSFAKIPGSERVAIGFAQSETYAIGITIDARTLDRDQIFREFRKQKLVSVVPTTDQGKLHFQVVRAGGDLESARAVDAEPPFFIGASSAGLERVIGKGARDVIWAFSSEGGDVTVPRVGTLPGVGHAVTFRRGGQNGKIVFGWLTAAGKKRTGLTELPIDGLVGTPTLAASENQILVAVASRQEKAAEWKVMLATAKASELPKKVTRFKAPPGGPGGEVMSPAAAALRGNRWIFQWTEGSSGNRVVRAQVLGADLAPLSAAVNLSPEGANAGQGAVFAHNDTGAVVFYVQNEKKSHELWGASVECAD